jgi:hypothetical protein
VKLATQIQYAGDFRAAARAVTATAETADGWIPMLNVPEPAGLAGRKREAEAAVPAGVLEGLTPIGPPGYVPDRVLAFQDMRVTYPNGEPVGPDPVGTIAALRGILDSC